MNPSVIVAVISAAAGLVAAAASYYFTKKKEREADWRKYKFEQYKEFMVSISGIVGGDSTADGNRNFAKACNTLHLIGSKGVLNALHAYQEEIRFSNPDKSPTKEKALLSSLIWEIREDAGIPGTPDMPEFSVNLWCSGTSPEGK